MGMELTAHFDRRGATYDANETHRRIIELLVGNSPLRAGMHVVDVATGTGAAALRAAEVAVSVLGIDLSEGMLVEARRKAVGRAHVNFIQADAERFDLAAGSVDGVFCASGVVMMGDIPGALRRWAGWLKPGGFLAFDVPAKPFGFAEMIAEAAVRHGVVLPYDTVADTTEKCRALVEGAGLGVERILTEVVSDEVVGVEKAIAFLDERVDHPAWRGLREASREVREAVRGEFVGRVRREAGEGEIRGVVVQHFVYGRK